MLIETRPSPQIPLRSVNQDFIQVDDIHKSFGDLEVLKGVTFSATQNQVVSLIGSSGSGKSTVLRCINLLEIPERGEIIIDGQPLPLSAPNASGRVITNRKALRDIRAKIGMVFQSFNLWSHLTVLQNVIEGPVQVLGQNRKEAIERADALLERVGIFDKRDTYPAKLSGGQQQRAAIARTLAMDPKVILFDEPTSALDPEMIGEVLAVMRDLADEGRSMIVVTHEMDFAREVSDKVVFLDKGIVGEEGPPAKLFSNPGTENCRQFLQRIT